MARRWPRWSDRSALVAALAVLATGWVCIVQLLPTGKAADWVPDLLAGSGVIVAGLVACSVGESVLPGLSVVLAGAAWFVANLALLASGPTLWLADHGQFLHRGLLAAAALMVSGRRRHWAITVPLVVAPTVIGPLMRSTWGTIGWGVLVLVIAAFVARRSRLWTLAPGVMLGLVVTGTTVGLAESPSDARAGVVRFYEFGMLAVAGSLSLVVAVDRARRDRLSDAVVELASGPVETVRKLIADAVGDRDVDVAFAVGAGWVDEFGASRATLRTAPRRRTIDVVIGGRRVAQFSCAEEIARQASVAAAIERAATLLARNAGLRADLRTEAEEIRQSRRRLVVATGEQRVRLSGELQRATDDSIADIDAALAAVAADGDRRFDEVVGRAQIRLQLLRDDLQALTSGLGPLSLASGDLSAAIRELLGGIDMPRVVDIDPVDVDSDVATALYFVCSEAVSNSIKHSMASQISVKLHALDGTVRLEIADDGVGGADSRGGSGLRGLADRVGAFDGTFDVISRAGAGTRVLVTVPVGWGGRAATSGSIDHGVVGLDGASPIRTHGTAK